MTTRINALIIVLLWTNLLHPVVGFRSTTIRRVPAFSFSSRAQRLLPTTTTTRRHHRQGRIRQLPFSYYPSRVILRDTEEVFQYDSSSKGTTRIQKNNDPNFDAEGNYIGPDGEYDEEGSYGPPADYFGSNVAVAEEKFVPSGKKSFDTETTAASPAPTVAKQSSRIRSIRSRNLGGAVASTMNKGESSLPGDLDHDDFLSLSLQDGRLIAVTGETGSGKSLLISKVVDLCSGGKATASLLSSSEAGLSGQEGNPGASATVEMDLELREPQLSMVRSIMTSLGLNPTAILNETEEKAARLHVQRIISKSKSSARVTSKCQLQSTTPITLKQLQAIMSPLLAIVDAPKAASALQQPLSRLSMIDTVVASEVLEWVGQAQTKHRQAKRERLRLEKELKSRTLPVSLAKQQEEDGETDLALLQHWIDELDSLENRVQTFCESIAQTNAEYGSSSPNSALSACYDTLSDSNWMDTEDDMSTIYKSLLELVDELKYLEDRIEAARNANMALFSLSSTSSVATALEQSRAHLLDATQGMNEEDTGGKIQQAAEQSHDLLNQLEDALLQCAKFMEDDEKGLLAMLTKERQACGFSVDEVFELVSEWNLMARKHGISPYLLPSCHRSLRQELDGNVEARTMLPKAIAAEKEALEELTEACAALSEARQQVTSRLSESISARLPLLGMESSTFEARLEQINQPGTSTASLGVDGVDFVLIHNGKGGNANTSSSSYAARGGKVDAVASSGEKARILLAIECELPGSVRALCATNRIGSSTDANGSSKGEESLILSTAPPLAVVYDEIDAHVGGRAAVFLAQMLADQSRSSQVLSITHSPSVAAVADTHVVVHKQTVTGQDEASTYITETTARVVSGTDRRKELARMASGDLAMEEAEIFAEALLRDGAGASSSSSAKR